MGHDKFSNKFIANKLSFKCKESKNLIVYLNKNFNYVKLRNYVGKMFQGKKKNDNYLSGGFPMGNT